MDSKIRLNETNYTNVLSYCIQIADCGKAMYMKEFKLQSQEVEEFLPGSGQYMINVCRISLYQTVFCFSNCESLQFKPNVKLPPELSNNDLVILINTRSGNEREIEATIDKIKSDHLLVQVKDNYGKRKPLGANTKYNESYQIKNERNFSYLKTCLEKNQKFDVHFMQTRKPIKMEYNALAIVENESLSSFMFPKSVTENVVNEIQ
jgi:hypothetical protein